MKFENLKMQLSKEILPAYFIGGEDNYLVNYSLSLIEKACNIAYPDFNKIIFDKEGFSATDIVSACEVLPIMDSKRLVIVKDYLGVKNEGEKNILLQYLKNPLSSTCLVLLANTQNNFYLSLVPEVEYVDCNKLSINMLTKWIASNVTSKGYSMDNQTCKIIIEYCNYNLSKIDIEINKLIAYKNKDKIITLQDVEKLVSKDEEYIIFELSDALLNKQLDKAYSIVKNLYYNKNTPTMVLSYLTGYFRRLLFSAISDFTTKQIADMMNVKEFAIIKAKEQSKRLTKLKLKKIYDLCLDVEYKIKSGKMDGENAIEYLMTNIIKE